jgi:Protein of unknown function (Hypoth_ymh)
VLIYFQETVVELRKLFDYAKNLQQKFGLGREASELLLDAESLSQRLIAVIEQLPDPAMSGNSRRHLSWLVAELKKDRFDSCKSDIDDLVNNDIPRTIEKIEQWAKDMAYMDKELRDAVVPLIRTRHFDSAIRKAFVILTDRLRSTYSLPLNTDGEGLVNMVFGKNSTHHPSMDAGKKQAHRDWMSGLYGVIRNKFVHGNHEPTIAELEAALSSVNLCLQIIEELKGVA